MNILKAKVRRRVANRKTRENLTPFFTKIKKIRILAYIIPYIPWWMMLMLLQERKELGQS